VVALPVIMKMITVSVKIVHTTVSLVSLSTIVIFVKIHIIEFQPNVNVLMDTMMPVYHYVTHVPSSVKPVSQVMITPITTVLPVKPLDNKTHHIVIAHMVLMLMLKVSAKTVNIHVNLVNLNSITVPSVLISEFKNQTVSAQMDTMIMDITQNVKNVVISVLPVATEPVVTLVNNTELKIHQSVLAQSELTNVVKTDMNVVLVLTNVSPVLETKTIVKLVLKTE
jgi:hypothetical protein